MIKFFNYPSPTAGNAALRDPGRELFADFNERDWRLVLDHSDLLNFSAGDEIVRAGDQEDAVYILVEGLVVRGKVVDEIEAGSAFGEVSFFDLSPRTATVRAKIDVTALIFSRANLERLFAKSPAVALAVVLEFGRLLAQHYRPLRARE
jgi:CRP-like cAMP-binding protein